MVEEDIDGQMTLNQPAGHLESGESLIDAVIRETQEETAWSFVPTDLVGIYRWQHPASEETYMRYCFTGEVNQHDENQALDEDIHQALWLSQQELLARQNDFRSPLVLDCFNDYLNGQRYPLTILHN
ncbi:MAG: NUDIX hydrolase [Gammaproteobacteria bacterium]|nr:NUDIX hydrolase [Pseudomonadota bacterium]PCH65798.1 MAG: NUDIX hydrolase [Gammaproteobacteria bacterium]